MTVATTETGHATPAPARPLGWPELVGLFGRLRWQAFRGAIRSPGGQRWTAILGLVASFLVGLLGGLGLAIAGQVIDPRTDFLVVVCTAICLFVVAIGVIAGVGQPIDPRVLATEPLTDRQLSVGLLTGSALGPPGLSAFLVAVGLFVGALDGPVVRLPLTMLVLAAAVGTLLLTLLLISRSTINALGVLATRHPRAGQVLVGLMSLSVYGGFQVVPRVVGDVDAERMTTLAAVLRFSPPGQIGRALGAAASSPVVAAIHVVLAAAWLIPLAWVFERTTQRLIVASPEPSTRTSDGREPPAISRLARRLCGDGVIGALAWRGILTRLRTPRSALETFIGGGVGLAIVVLPALFGNQPGAGAVLVGGAVQLSVLFMAGNCFGSDGPALATELMCGIDPELILRAKVRSVLVVASPIAVIGPLIAAGATGEWRFFPAALLIGVAGLLGGAGGAIVQSTVVPIAIPDSDNPLASGDTGKGCFAGITLAAVVIGLAVITLPIALALLWAVDRNSSPLVTLFALATVGAGFVVRDAGIRFATREWRRREPEIYDAVIPAR